MTFALTPKQVEAQKILAGDATHSLLEGGSRSGKTFLIVRAIVIRALKAAGSRHVVFRYRFNAVKSSVWLDTFPKVMAVAFPGVAYSLNKTDFFATFENGSEFWFGGLDDKERAEKVLGMEFATIYLNESSQIPYASRNIALTRLAQQVATQVKDGAPGFLKPRMYYDANPPKKSHWLYRLFHQKVDPDTKRDVSNPQDYVHAKINPRDNEANLAAGYLDTLDAMSPALRKRFRDGEYGDATPGALFSDECFDTWRVLDGSVPEMVRVVVAVDPSGSGDEDNADNDAIGIMVAGLGTDGNAYLLEDCTVKAGPLTWGRIATSAFDRHAADVIVGETNYGGAMVKHVIQTARNRTPFKMVTATRGKHVRAEPFSALCENGKVRHVGLFPDLEDELTAMSTLGYTGQGSPNRADAWVWALAELFPAMTSARAEPVRVMRPPSSRTAFNRLRA